MFNYYCWSKREHLTTSAFILVLWSSKCLHVLTDLLTWSLLPCKLTLFFTHDSQFALTFCFATVAESCHAQRPWLNEQFLTLDQRFALFKINHTSTWILWIFLWKRFFQICSCLVNWTISWSVYDKDHMSEMRIKNRSESDLRSCEET